MEIINISIKYLVYKVKAVENCLIDSYC